MRVRTRVSSSRPDLGRSYSSVARVARAAILALLLLADTYGQAVDTPEGFEPIESALLGFMQANALPGASLAIAKNGKLVFAHGYGLADVEKERARAIGINISIRQHRKDHHRDCRDEAGG